MSAVLEQIKDLARAVDNEIGNAEYRSQRLLAAINDALEADQEAAAKDAARLAQLEAVAEAARVHVVSDDAASQDALCVALRALEADS